MTPHITVEELKGLLRLDTDTNQLYWKVRMGRNKIGSKAGSMDKANGFHSVMIMYKRYAVSHILFAFKYGRWPVGKEGHKRVVKAKVRAMNTAEMVADIIAKGCP